MNIIVVKVGTQSILSAQGTILINTISNLVEQIVKIHKGGTRVVLVSSGAVGSGRGLTRELFGHEYGSSMVEKQLLASIGQPELMHIYSRMLKQHHMLAAQLLLTKQDFHTRQHYLNIGRLLREVMQHEHIIPIINENDSVAVEELMFTDNDELAGLLAAQLDAAKLILLTGVQGIYDGNPEVASSKIIPVIRPSDKIQIVTAGKSTLGRGGMHSKLGIAYKLAHLGITTHVAHVAAENVLLKIISGESVGTKILPAKKKSSTKRWMAFGLSKNQGAIYLNQGLSQLLWQGTQATSILPVGIEKVSGDFKKGDLIDIFSYNRKKIGIGIARYGVDKLQEYLGKQHKPVLVHYDRLYVESVKN